MTTQELAASIKDLTKQLNAKIKEAEDNNLKVEIHGMSMNIVDPDNRINLSVYEEL